MELYELHPEVVAIYTCLTDEGLDNARFARLIPLMYTLGLKSFLTLIYTEIDVMQNVVNVHQTV